MENEMTLNQKIRSLKEDDIKPITVSSKQLRTYLEYIKKLSDSNSIGLLKKVFSFIENNHSDSIDIDTLLIDFAINNEIKRDILSLYGIKDTTNKEVIKDVINLYTKVNNRKQTRLLTKIINNLCNNESTINNRTLKVANLFMEYIKSAGNSNEFSSLKQIAYILGNFNIELPNNLLYEPDSKMEIKLNSDIEEFAPVKHTLVASDLTSIFDKQENQDTYTVKIGENTINTLLDFAFTDKKANRKLHKVSKILTKFQNYEQFKMLINALEIVNSNLEEDILNITPTHNYKEKITNLLGFEGPNKVLQKKTEN